VHYLQPSGLCGEKESMLEAMTMLWRVGMLFNKHDAALTVL